MKKEVRIVVASVRGFHDVDRLKVALGMLLNDVYLMNECVEEEDEIITDDKIVILTNGDDKTISQDITVALAGRAIEVEVVPVDWSKGNAAFFKNCEVLGTRATHGIVFTDKVDEGMGTLIKACLVNGARMRIYTTTL